MTTLIRKIAHTFPLFVAIVCLATSLFAETQGTEILLSKARSLEARGRMDLAAQDWQEVLLVNPNQTEALAGLARYAKENGNAQDERNYLDRLKRINPKDPQIAVIENMHILSKQEIDKLDLAGRFAMQHKPDEAMKLYSEVFGNRPPTGKWAEPYYETEAASTSGRGKAITQLRQLTASDPQNETYRLWLARVLVYDPATRAEGLRLLASIQEPAGAEQARTLWREALVWEKENPAVLSSLNAYLHRYNDPQLQSIQKTLQAKQENAQEEANKAQGFQALRKQDIPAAEARFQQVLRRNPNDVNAVAGLAFVRLNQKRFDDAVALFDRARALDPKRKDVRDGYATAKFWSLMQQGARAMQANQPEPAIAAYQAALALHPNDTDAVLGIAQAELREKQLPEAETRFQQVLNKEPNNADALSGLGFVRLDQKRFDDAAGLFERARSLTPNRPDLEQAYNDARFWSFMQRGATALDQNNSSAAILNYRQALGIRPGAPDALQGLAGAAERSKNFPQAEQAYKQLAAANPADAKNWIALIRLELAAHNSAQAIETAQGIPASVRPEVERRADYLADLAFAYLSTNQSDRGDQLLAQAMNAASAADTNEALNRRLEIAALLVNGDRVNKALPIYQQAVGLHPENAIAWQGLVGAYARQQQFAKAASAVQSMPRDAYELAAKDPGFLNSVAGIYLSQGECGKAEDFLHHALALDRAAGRQPSEDSELQLADIWLRERNYPKAADAYEQILRRNPNSPDAWRGYFNALHNNHEDQHIISESQHIPSTVRAQLDRDPDFLALLAGAYSSSGQTQQTVNLLQQARSLYESQHGAVPANLDLQLAWAMLNNPGSDLGPFIRKVMFRSDLTSSQRATADQILSYWTVREANNAVAAKQWDRAIAMLENAQRDLPNDPRIYSTLALVYVNQHKFKDALDIYGSWNMAGAQAGDYQAAAGAALGTHKNDLAEFYLRSGLQRFPEDAGLLEMEGRQEIARGNYKEGEGLLRQALFAARNPDAQRTNAVQEGPHASGAPAPASPAYSSAVPSSSTQPSCRANNQQSQLRRGARLIDAGYREEDQTAGQDASESTGQTQSGQGAPTPEQGNASPSSAGQSGTPANNAQSNPDQRQRLEDEIDVVQNRNTPFAEINEVGSGRAGEPGFDRLLIEEGRVGGSVTAFDKVRVTTYAKGLYLYSGSPSGRSQLRFGTLAPGATFSPQETGGMIGELQIATQTFGLDLSATPSSFPVQNVLGGLRYRLFGGPFTFLATRDSVKDSLLSYAGTRDPGTGLVWGGVVANTGTLRFDHNSRRAGQYASGGYSYLTGEKTPPNQQVFGSAGLYFAIVKNLSVGVNAFGMHYQRNLSFFSFAQGGYFSPQQYGLASIPVSWFSRHKRFEYEIRASLGAQYISQDASSFYPTRLSIALPTQGSYNASTATGANYSFLGRLGYRITSHLYLEAFANANNTRNYAFQSVGFSIKILAHRLPTNTDLHVNSIPDWRGDQPFGLY